MQIGTSTLLQIGNLNSDCQPRSDTSAKSAALSQVGKLNLGNQPASNKKMLVNLPAEWKMDGNAEMETNIEGNHVVDVKQ